MARSRLRESLFVGLAVSIALLLSVAAMLRSNGVTADSYEYMHGGLSVVAGEGYRSLTGREQTVFPPAYPLLVGLTNLLTRGPVTAGQYVSMAASAASVVLIFLLGRTAFTALAGVSAAFLLALLPLRVQSSIMVLSESTFLAFALLGLLLWVVSEARPWMGFLSGLSLGAAYLTRPEGLLVFAICAAVVAASLLRQGRPRSPVTRRLTTMLIGFALISLPFWMHLRQHTGRWALTGKAEMNLAIASDRSEGVAFRELRRLDERDEEIVYGLTQASAGQHLRRVLLNLRTVSKMLGDMTGIFLVACLGLGLAAALQLRRPGRVAFFTLAAIAGALLLTAASFFVEYRMLLAPVTLLILLGASALFPQGASEPQSFRVYRRVTVWLLVLAAVQLAAGSGLLIAAPIGSPADDVTPLLAAIEREHDAPGPIIGNSREPRALAFATRRDCLDLPWEPLPHVLRYAAHHRASFMLVSGDDHPDLAALARRPVATDCLQPLAHMEFGAAGERRVFALFRIRTPKPAG